ncbi:hypothetical protein D3C73_901610 [compost metagenome]
MSLKDLVLKIQDWIKYFVSKWYFFLVIGILGALLGFFYAKYKEVNYIATTTFVLENGDQGGGLGQYAGMAAMVGIDVGGSGQGMFQGDNLLELYKSRKMIEAALLQKSPSDSSKVLMDRYLSLHGARANWEKKSPDLLKIDFQKKSLSGQNRMQDSIFQKTVIEINRTILKVGMLDKKSSIIKVDVSSNDEVFSKEFNQALVNEVNTFYIETKTKKSLNNIEILQNKADSVRGIMNGSINIAASVVDATPNLNPTRQAQRLVPTQRAQFSAETNKAILGQLIQNLEMAKMALMKEAPLIQEVDKPIYPLMNTKLSKSLYAAIGALLACFVTFIFLFINRIYNKLIK